MKDMGSGDWFKTVISLKKAKGGEPKRIKGSSKKEKSNGFKWGNRKDKNSKAPKVHGMLDEDAAATKIQTAYRGYKARKTLRRLKGVVRFKDLALGNTVTKQTSIASNYIHTWSKLQNQIRARRQCMVIEGRIRQKKLENQLKLETKLHDLEVEWCGGSDTMEDILARIQQREEAAVKRERAMAYAFSHQWRANSGQNPGRLSYELGKANWGWSWMERWIAARPWENRLPVPSTSPKKVPTKQVSKVVKNASSPAKKVSVKTALSNGKGSANVKSVSVSPPKSKETSIKQEQLVI